MTASGFSMRRGDAFYVGAIVMGLAAATFLGLFVAYGAPFDLIQLVYAAAISVVFAAFFRQGALEAKAHRQALLQEPPAP